MEEFVRLLDERLDYIRHEIVGDTVYIYVESNREEPVCPYCGTPSTRKHSVYERSFQDLPIMGKKTKIILENRKMFCVNPDCPHTTFAEIFAFLSPKGKKSRRLLDKIVDISLNVSSLAAAELLKDGIADVGKSTICNLLKKDTLLPQKEMVTKVCVDDFAIRKRHTYGTIMVDMESRRVIDLLPSREIEDVVEWLKTYPNLSIVSRDGSVSYHSAISQANTAIVQVSDRFHLLKGFTDAAKKFLTRFLSANFCLPQEASHYAGTATADYWSKEGKEDFPTKEHKQTLERKTALVKKYGN